MKFYKATGDSTFSEEEVQSQPDTGFVKIKISKVIPTTSDVDIFSGKAQIAYPMTPCHMAIGVVSDDRPEYELKRGSKVILNPYIYLPVERLDMAPRVKCYGVNKDGFLADFVNVPVDHIVPFPEEVKEDEAIFCEYISVALATINACHLEKGDYIAIIGGSVLCNIIAQLALYFQAIPILVDGSAERLALAEKCGVYYTVNMQSETPLDRVREITGGGMAEHCILEATQNAVPSHLFNLAKFGGDCVVVSINSYLAKLETDINVINTKQLKVKGVSNGITEFNSAVNVLAQKLLTFNKFIDKKVKIEDAEVFFRELDKERGKYFCPMITI